MSDEPIKPDPSSKPKRPTDPNKQAKVIVDIATGQVEDANPDAVTTRRSWGDRDRVPPISR